MFTKFDLFLESKTSNNLYHVTNISNLQDIQKHGLIPTFGNILKQAYGGDYDFDGDSKDEELVKIPFKGIIFFSEIPHLHYSSKELGHKKLNKDDILLCVVKKNNTIYHKVDDYPRFTDYQNYQVSTIDYNDVYELPIFIETNDWFSFEDQDPQQLLYGDKLINFLEKKFPDKLKDII
jgi:hypothetical protein